MHALIKPKCSLHLVACNIHIHIKEQIAPARTLETLKIDVCRVSGRHIQDSTSVISLRSSDATSVSRYNLREWDDSASDARGQAVFGIALNMQAERVMLDRILVNSGLCKLRSSGSECIHSRRLKDRSFVVCVYAPTDFNSLEAKDEFYRELSRLLCGVRSTDVVVVADHFTAQLGYLVETEGHIGCTLVQK